MIKFAHASILLALTVLSACVSRPTTTAPEKVFRGDPRSPAIFRGDGRSATWDELVTGVADADVVFVGENHGHPFGLASAAALWDDLLARCPDAALSLEFFERDDQSHVDDYLGGIVDDATFRKITRRTPGSYPGGHHAMVELAKAHGRPVIASNAPRQYVRVASKSGFDALEKLNDRQKALFRVPDQLPTGKYREDFDKIMGGMSGHGGSDSSKKEEAPDPEKAKAALDAAFRSQSLWDWTMGESIAMGLDEGHHPVLQVVGCFHCDFGGGLVQAVRSIHPGARIVVVSFVSEPGTAFRGDDKERGDFVVYVGKDE